MVTSSTRARTSSFRSRGVVARGVPNSGGDRARWKASDRAPPASIHAGVPARGAQAQLLLLQQRHRLLPLAFEATCNEAIVRIASAVSSLGTTCLVLLARSTPRRHCLAPPSRSSSSRSAAAILAASFAGSSAAIKFCATASSICTPPTSQAIHTAAFDDDPSRAMVTRRRKATVVVRAK